MNEDGDLETSKPVNRVAKMKEIESLGIDRETFENIEREFQDFLQEIVGKAPLEKFKKEYEQTYELLKGSYRTEQDLIKRCLELNKNALESAKDVNIAIKLATAEMEKIEGLQMKVENAFAEVASKKVKEEESRQEIQSLKIDIANLKRQQSQATELEEDKQLRELKNEYDDLLKITNDQTDQIIALKYRNNELEDEKKQLEDEINKMDQDKDNLRKNIDDIRNTVKQMEVERKSLEDKKIEMKNAKKDEKVRLEVKNVELKECEARLEEK